MLDIWKINTTKMDHSFCPAKLNYKRKHLWWGLSLYKILLLWSENLCFCVSNITRWVTWCRYHSTLLSRGIYQVNSIVVCTNITVVIWEPMLLCIKYHPLGYMVQIPQHPAFTRDLPSEFHCFLLIESDLDVCVVGGDRSVQIEAWRRP